MSDLSIGTANAAIASRFDYRHISPNGWEARFRIQPHTHSPMLRAGAQLLHRRPVVILGISPGNGYFTRERIEIAVCGMASLLGNVTVVIPDTIAAHTFRALGYDEKQSREKARHNGQNIKNRCEQAIKKARACFPEARIEMPDWETGIAAVQGYSAAYDQIKALYTTNQTFRLEICSQVKEVLASKTDVDALHEDAVQEATEYLLKELAHLVMCRPTFGREVLIAYYRHFSLLDLLWRYGFGPQLAGVGGLIYDIEPVVHG